MAERKPLAHGRNGFKRRLVQLYSALLYNANIKGFIKGEIYTGATKSVCVPGLNCYSCPGAVASCPLGALQNALASSNAKAGAYIVGILLLFGVIFGRTVCGWLCPFGLVQEMLHKIPSRKVKKGRATRVLSCLKYVILAGFVVALPLWYRLAKGLPVPAFCKYICPAGTLEGALALLAHPANKGLLPMLGALFMNKVVLLILTVAACVFVYRAFCRFLCPLGALYGLFNRFALIGMRVDAEKCTRCGACVRTCPMDIHAVGDKDCISCGRCANACKPKAISFMAGRIDMTPNVAAADRSEAKSRRREHIFAACALTLLIGWFAYVNFSPDATLQTAATPITDRAGSTLVIPDLDDGKSMPISGGVIPIEGGSIK